MNHKSPPSSDDSSNKLQHKKVPWWLVPVKLKSMQRSWLNPKVRCSFRIAAKYNFTRTIAGYPLDIVDYCSNNMSGVSIGQKGSHPLPEIYYRSLFSSVAMNFAFESKCGS